MNTETLKQLAPEIHQNAKDHGWWDSPRSLSDQFNNFDSEAIEAWEEYRHKRGFTEIYFQNHKTGSAFKPAGGIAWMIDKAKQGHKPEGIPIELADLLIRLMDSAEHYGWDLTKPALFMAPDWHNFSEFISFIRQHLVVAEHAIITGRREHGERTLSVVCAVVSEWFTAHNLDLEQTMRLKIEFNRTREYRHGGKVA